MKNEDSFGKELHVLMYPMRYRIVEMLRKKPMNINEISKALEKDERHVSYHLNILEKYGFLNNKYEMSEQQKSKGKAIRRYNVTEKLEDVISEFKKISFMTL